MTSGPSATDTNRLHAAHALLPDGWARDVLIEWDAHGVLTTVRPGAPADGATRAYGPVLPGLPNLHSHAFQRAFAGLTERRSAASRDSFWTWRDAMYRFALAVSPQQLEAIATQLYVEMLRAGYTSVCEFHYLHHAPDGSAYADPAEMARRLARAAAHAGIAITLLPVLYQDSGFGGTPPRAEQRRFLHRHVDALLRIVDACARDGIRAGVAPHSLRAVGPDALRALLSGLDAIDPTAPIHIHIAEQRAEVDECIAWSGARPVQWLLDHAPVDARWCLVHATHVELAELQGIASRGAVVGLCPTTEANLGDGVFDMPALLDVGGRWGIGSDSHASVSATEELRLLEYGQRLARWRRNVIASEAQPDVADSLWSAAADGGARAAGRDGGRIAVGGRADLVALDADGVHAGLSSPAQVLAGAVFANSGARAIRDVWVGGVQRVSDGRHALEQTALADFVAARAALVAAA